jgi:outer membrane receptor protein involved in Fe transport
MRTRITRAGSLILATMLLVPAYTSSVFAAEGRQIEEVIVTAERRESTISDTAISITAFTGEFIEDFGLRNQEDLQNYIPATVIQPYDLSVRGVGRLYRALGGDPGVATYFDGAYSEDFGIASTEGGLFDLERIEVLRGPQGTLYGRNGIGGAVNFHSKKPTDEFEGEIKTIIGSHGAKEFYGVISGPIIEGKLNGRVTGIKRTRDGFVDELGDKGHARDLNNYGDENYALALEWTPSDKVSVLMRGNERSYRRNMSGAQGASAVVVSEMGGVRDPVTGGERWTSNPVYGWRQVQDPNGVAPAMCASATDRSVADCIVPTGLVPYINGTGAGQTSHGLGVYSFTHNGDTRYGQSLVGGVDGIQGGNPTNAFQNYGYGSNAAEVDLYNRSTLGSGRELPELDGDDLQTWSNGLNDEFFDQQAAYLRVTWDVMDNFTLKYIGGYTDYFYDRTTEHDRSGRTNDLQFYAAQENENFQHEIQFFVDIGDDITLTGGLFMYENDIDQQLDFYSSDSWSKYTSPDLADSYGTQAGLYALFFPGSDGAGGMVNHRTAQNMVRATPGLGRVVDNPATAADETFGGALKTSFQINSLWHGDTLENGRVDHGPVSDGTTFIWDTENRTSAQAFYIQGEWQMTDTWALTLGARWAEDHKEAEENLFVYAEANVLFLCDLFATDPALCGDGNGDGTTTLAEYNQNITGGIDASGNIADFDRLRTRGVPLAAAIYRQVEDDYDALTWRVNVDYSPTDDALVYFSITTGYRAGGFNLGFSSPTPNYEKEEIISYELGYKGTLFDGTMQLNASIYRYEYDGIALQFLESGGFFGEGTSVTNGPDVETHGAEIDIMWLIGDNFTLGGTASWTQAQYVEELNPLKSIVDNANPNAPQDLFGAEALKVSVDGEPLPRIPEFKWTLWGEYRQPMGDQGTLTFLSTLGWTDEFAASGTPKPDGPLTTAPAYLRWDARAGWESADNQWNVSVFVNNITDDIGVRNMTFYNQNEAYRRTTEPTNPRMYGLELQYKFGAFQ